MTFLRRAIFAVAGACSIAIAVSSLSPLPAAAVGNSYPQTATGDQAMTYQINPSHTGSTGAETLTVPLQPGWTIDLGGPVSYPVMGPSYIYVTISNLTTTHPNLYAINYQTGAIAWGPIDLGGSWWANASYDNGLVFTINANGQMQAFDEQTGAVQWTTQLPGQSQFTSPPASSVFGSGGDLVYTSGAGSGGTLYAVHANSGAIAWQAPVMNGDHSAPVVTETGVYVSYACAQTYDFEPLHGALLWHHATGCEGGGGKTAALYNGRLYVRDAIVGNTVLDAASGATLGSFNATAVPAFSGSTGFFLNGSTVQAVNLSTNGVLWSFSGDGTLATAPIVVNGNVYVGASSGNIYAVDAGTGTQTWSAHLNSPIAAPDEQNASHPLNGLSAGYGFLTVPAGNTLTLFGSPLQVAPGSYNFGVKQVGSSTTVPVKITDNFAGAVTISSVTASGDYSVSANTCVSLTNSQWCAFNVTFIPGAYGQRNGTVTINDGAPGSPHTVMLIGAGSDYVIDHLVLTPSSATIAAGGSLGYEAEGYDAYGNDGGNYTPVVTFYIDGGTCSANVCTTSRAGSRTVSAQYQAPHIASGSTSLTVTPGALDHITILPASAGTAAGAPQSYTTEGFDQYGNDLGSATAATTFSISPDGSCSGASCTATVAGAHTVTATDNYKTATASLTVTAGPVASLTISPASTGITAGGATTYSTTASDQYGNSLGDVTSATTFTIAPDGACTQASCTATVAGTHTVTGSSNGKTATATLFVGAGPLDHITLSPGSQSIAAGISQNYVAEAYDQYGNDMGNDNGATTFSISPDGSCTFATCSATIAGGHTVSAVAAGKTATATLTVTPGQLATLTLTPASTTITAGGNTTYTATGADQYGNNLGDVTYTTSFSIAPDGSCNGPNCTTTRAGNHTVTGSNSGKTGTATVTVNPAAFDHITLTPASATITAGASQAFAVEAFDLYGNDLGDQTAASSLRITPDGSCTTGSCSATREGNHTVTATYSGKSAAASLWVNPSQVVASISLNPGSYNIPAGIGATFYIATIDQYGNAIAVLNSGFSLTMGPPTTACPGSTCTATKVGTYTITATYQGFTSSGTLVIRPAALDHITLTPATATIAAGGSQGYAVEGFDQYGNDIGSLASTTNLSVNGASCSNMTCTAFTAGNLTVMAISGGKTATATLTVTPGPIARLMVSPSSATLAVQTSQLFTASGTDAYSNPVSVSGATWSLASRTPGTLSSTTGSSTTFKASSYFTGTGGVIATISGISASATITVIPATPSNLTADVKPAKVNLGWHPAAGAYTYALYRGTSSSNLVLLKASLASTSFTDAPGVGTFYYQVVAVGPTGLQSAPSNIVSATFK